MRAIRVQAVLGEGDGGRTVRATWDPEGGSPFAFKIVVSPTRRAILRHEFFALRGLAHPNLVRALDYGTFSVDGEPTHGLVLELVQGVPLARFGRTWADVASPLADALEALLAMHRQGYVHGDVKPDNVMVREDGRGILLDLGAATPLGTPARGERSGTPGFLAPEAGTVPVARTLDVFAVGATLRALRQRGIELPTPVARWMHSALESDARPPLEELLDPLRGPVVPPSIYVPRLVGRRALLDAAVEAVLAGRSVCLVGPAGSGRTRLLGELRWALADRRDAHLIDEDHGLGAALDAEVVLADEPSARLRESLARLAAERVVVVAASSPLACSHVALALEPLGERDTAELFEPSFPAALVRRAHAATAGLVKPLVRLARAATQFRPTAAAVDRALRTEPETAEPPTLAEVRQLRLRGQAERASTRVARGLRTCILHERTAWRIEAAACLLARGQTRRVQRLLGRLQSDEPRAREVEAELGLKLGTYADSLRIARSVVGTEPDVTWSLALTEAAALTWLDAPEADAAIERACGITGPYPRLAYRARSVIAQRHHRKGRVHEAAQAFREAARLVEAASLDDLRATSSYNVATAEEQAGELGVALETYERTARLAHLTSATATLQRSRFALANLYFELGHHERAARHAALVTGGVVGALAEALLGEARGDAAAVAAARTRLDPDGAEALEVATAEARCVPASPARLASLLRWAERLEAPDLVARVLVLVPEASAPRLEAALAEQTSRFRALDLHERLHALYTEQGATLHAREHAERAVYLAETLLAELPAALREPLGKRVAPLRAGPAVVHAHEEHGRLFEVQRRLSAATDVDALLGEALDSAIGLAGAERGFVVLGAADGTLQVRAARNLDESKLSKRELSFSRSIVREVIATQTARFAVRAEGDEFLQSQRSVHAQKLRAVVALPFRTGRGVDGALYLDNRFVATSPSNAAREVLLFLRDQIAAALDRALLLAELAERNAQLEEKTRELEARLEQETLTRHAARKRATPGKFPAIVGDSEPMQRALAVLERVAQADVTVLIEGESGTGKELFARALHDESARRAGPFVAINCGAMPETLLEAELFGAQRGAFTGAVKDTRGLFVAANGGTLFLDEIGEMPLSMQVKLLRVLQQREVRALGAEHATPIDLRVVGATHRDLEEEVQHGRFREDLFFRLAVVRLSVPPLRERGADVVAIANVILDHAAERLGVLRRELGPSALRALVQHRFPGNVRELENALTKALVLSGGEGPLEAEHLGLPPPAWTRARRTPATQEKRALAEALEATHGNVVAAAKRLGMPRATFYRKLARHGLRE